ncbi:hypothetical protein IE53DRAFT_381891, partial [Violaceomyces palustris]
MPSQKSVPSSVARSGRTKSQRRAMGLAAALEYLLTFDNVKTAVFIIVLYRYSERFLRHLKIYGLLGCFHQVYTAISRRIFELVLKTPAARRRVTKELDAAMKEVEAKIVSRPSHISIHEKLPVHGKDNEWIKHEIYKIQKMEAGIPREADSTGWEAKDGQLVWKDGRVSGAVYHGGQELSDLLADTIKAFLLSNP